VRPRSLAEAVRQHRSGRDFGVALNEFLDEFYLAAANERQAMLAEDPPFVGDEHLDAYIGAVAEHLARRWRLDHAPKWASDARRFLDWPWFPDGESPKLKRILLMESPIAFRRRQIFAEAEPLRRARMPRDSRALAHEAGF
jgi:hypothetical protein